VSGLWGPRCQSRAIAVDVRTVGSDAVVGVALIVPATRYLSFLGGDGDLVTPRYPTPGTWRGIDAVLAGMGSRLPFKPAPLPSEVVEVILGGAPTSPVLARRFAAMPVTVEGDDSATVFDGLLLGLLSHRRHTGARSQSLR